MDPLYTRASATATRLLTKYNQAVYLLTRAGTPIPGPEEWDEPTPGTPQTWTLQGISTAVGKEFVDGKEILTTDRMVLIAPFADEPKPGDMFSINGVVQTVLAIKKVTEVGVAWKIVIKG